MHTSVKLETPCEMINITPVNPLISKCQIKVCYVGDEPNRNRSVITKEVARSMANSLPGSPIVGKWNENKEDYEEHNRIISLKDGEWVVSDDTRPYGFVDLNAKVWFQKFLDDGVNEHEYLMTEGYLWTGQYPECQRVLTKGNNQSMELDEKNLDAVWSKDVNGEPKFFIINEAVISKLCILGEDVEPCFEGSQITNVKFSFEDGFKEQLFSMMNEMKKILKDGGETPMFVRYAVEIGDQLWRAIYGYLCERYPDPEWAGCSTMRIEGVYEESGNKFVIVSDCNSGKYYRINFNIDPEFVVTGDWIEVEKEFVPVSNEGPQFTLEAYNAFVESYKAEVVPEDVSEESEEEASEEPEDDVDEVLEESEPEEVSEEVVEEKKDELKDKVDEYNLDEIPEYIELKEKYNALVESSEVLQHSLDEMTANVNSLNEQLDGLKKYKMSIERKEKEAMIDSFYMLSDEDKKDVIANIDNYSLDDIEAKLSIICVRNKVSFDLNDDVCAGNTTFNLAGQVDTTPAWIKAVQAVAETME
jgi:hypothetical protein